MKLSNQFKTGADALSAANSAMHNSAPVVDPNHDIIRHDWDPTPDDDTVEKLRADLRARLKQRFAQPVSAPDPVPDSAGRAD